jgi:protein MpaA
MSRIVEVPGTATRSVATSVPRMTLHMAAGRRWRLLALSAGLLALLAAATPVVSQAAVPGHPALVETRVIGHTVKGRAIVAYRLGQPTSTRKAVIMAGMHGDEPGPSRILYNLIDGRPVKGADIWVIPVYNPDGRARNARQNAHGVDLNRNWPFHWVHLGGGTYSGSSAASEPETRAMMSFLNEVRPAYIVSFHQPLHGVGRAGGKGRPLVRRLHRQLHLPIKAFNCDGVCHGTMTEWYNRYFRGVAVTVEYGHGLSRRQANTTGPTGLLRAVGASR